MSAAGAAYAQLLSVGLVWISFHCSGMCGPLLIGFDVAGAARGVKAWKGALGVLTYQAGRATTYAVLGALAGLVGKGLAAVFEPAGAIFALLFGLTVVASLGVAWWRARRPPTFVRPGPTRLERRGESSKIETPAPDASKFEMTAPDSSKIETSTGSTVEARRGLGGLVDRLVGAVPRALHPLAGGDEGRHVRIFALGAAMGFLPCMITYWALGLAATTGSPVHGALVMLLLVAMTTPVLLGVTLLPRLVPRRVAGWLPRALMGLSGAWLVLVGLAGLEVIAHQHVQVGGYTVMLW